MKTANLLKSLCLAVACVIAWGCSSEDGGSKAVTGSSKNRKAVSDTAAKAGDEKDKGKSDTAGDKGAKTDGPTTKTLSDKEIQELFEQAGTEGGMRRDGDSLALLISINDGEELQRLGQLFTGAPETSSIKIVYGPDAYFAKPELDLSPLKQLTKLTELDLTELKISPQSLGELKSVKRLFLQDTPLADADLAIVVGLENLEFLSLAGTTVSDEGLAGLAALKTLRELDVRNTAVTDAGAAKLREAIAELKITLKDETEDAPE